MRLLALCLIWLGVSVVSVVTAQGDGLNLPTELYVLLNSGQVERYGVGAAGVEAVTPEDIFIIDFAIAPDNNWMAYRTEDGISLFNLRDNTTTPLGDSEADVPSVRGRGQTMAWSPDGTALAYTTTFGLRVATGIGGQAAFTNVVVSPIYNLLWSPDGTYLAAEAEQNVWWIYRRDGPQVTLTSALTSSVGASWLDNARLIFAPTEGGLLTMDMANANAQAQLQDASRVYLLPFRRPDGSIVVFSRPANAAEVGASSGSYQQFVLDNGTATIADSSDNLIDVNGLHWAPGGQLLVDFGDGALSLVLPTSGEAFTLPIQEPVAYGWGAPRPDNVTGFSLSYGGAFIAPDQTGIRQVWRLPVNGLPPIPLTVALSDITDYAISPDNAAYVTETSLWLQSLSSSNAFELVQTADAARDLSFNIGGDTLAYATPDQTGGIWLINAAQGSEPRLIVPNEGGTIYQNPQFAPNFNAVLVERSTDNVTEYLIYDPGSQELTLVGAFEHAEWLSDGRILAIYTTGDTPDTNLQVIDTAFGVVEATSILRASNGQIEDIQETAPGRIRVLLLGENLPGQSAYTLLEVSIESGEPDEIGSMDFVLEPHISPDGEFVAGYTQLEGALLIYSAAGNSSVTLDDPLNMTLFRWLTFR